MKSIMVKRLESSIYAFRQSVDRFIISYEKFIKMYLNGTIYISKKVDVYDLIESDDMGRLEALVQDEQAQKYSSDDFRKEFIENLSRDLGLLNRIQKIWKTVDTDPKFEAFFRKLISTPALKENKLVVFTESKETGDYLYERLQELFPGEIMFYSSAGGRHTNKKMVSKHSVAREIITSNFDPKAKERNNEIKILIATDVLSEGINLHLSNVLINYDLPWNPIRVLQRAGRVNRLGSTSDKVHIFNFFPTTQSDAHLGLEVNISNKIQMFHDILGEDAKYLSDGEEFGSQELFNTLNSKSAYTGEDAEGDSELKYLEMMRKIRDEQPELFEKIKNLPKKARSGFKKENLESDQLVTFFRIGKLKKFYLNERGESVEITFFDAANKLECKAETMRINLPDAYHHMLETNKKGFELDNAVGETDSKSSGGKSNAKYIENRLKDRNFKNYKGFTEFNTEFINGVKEMLAQGTIAKKTAQAIKNELERTLDPLQMLHILQKHIPKVILVETQKVKQIQKREVILSGYLIK
jgi:superfamily II DNA/RNA helicase